MFRYGKHVIPLHDYADVVKYAAVVKYTACGDYPDVVPMLLVLIENIRMPMKANAELESAIQATFLRACRRGDEAVVEACLKKNANPNASVEDRPV